MRLWALKHLLMELRLPLEINQLFSLELHNTAIFCFSSIYTVIKKKNQRQEVSADDWICICKERVVLEWLGWFCQVYYNLMTCLCVRLRTASDWLLHSTLNSTSSLPLETSCALSRYRWTVQCVKRVSETLRTDWWLVRVETVYLSVFWHWFWTALSICSLDFLNTFVNVV